MAEYPRSSGLSPKQLSMLSVGVLAFLMLAVGMVVAFSGIFTDESNPLEAHIVLDPVGQGPQGVGDVRVFKCSSEVGDAPDLPTGGRWTLGEHPGLEWGSGDPNRVANPSPTSCGL